MIIDGTNHEYNKIDKLKKHAESLGYDTYMVFVNTSLEVVAKKKETKKEIEFYLMICYLNLGQDVQNNLGKFQNLFGGNFRIVDNTVYKLQPKKYKSASK